MADLPNNAFDAETTCSNGRVQIGSADGPTQVKLFIKAAKGGTNSKCALRLEKESPNPAPGGAPVVTPVRGEVAPGMGQLKFVNLAANQDLYVRCMGDDAHEKCRFTVTFFG
jgi:hypothetical protein